MINFVHEEAMQPKELLDTYLQMLYEYMQRRSKLDSEAFTKVVEQSNSEEMVAEFKTVFQVAREEGREEGLCLAIKGLVSKTRLSDKVIALTLNVSVELVRTIREEVNAEKLATAKKAAKAATPKKETKPKTQKP